MSEDIPKELAEELEDKSPQISEEVIGLYHKWYHIFRNDYDEQKKLLSVEACEQLDDEATQLTMMIYLGLEMCMSHYHGIHDGQLEQAFTTAMRAFQTRYIRSDVQTPNGMVN